MNKIVRIVAFVVFLLALASPIHAAEQAAVDEIAKEIMCQCGCNMIVYNCDCGTAEQVRKEIALKLDGADGNPPMIKQQVIDYYVDKYGETVLAAPTKEGFNLAAWITPFIALAVGIVVVYVVVTRWLLASSKEPELVAVKGEGAIDEYEERFRRELEQFEGRS